MDGLFYVMAILGCGDASAACQQVRVESVRYVSREACDAASPVMLRRAADVDYPVIVAQCRRGTPQSVDRGQLPRG